MECLDLHPRISIVGVTVVTPHHIVAQRVSNDDLDVFVVSLVVAVNGLLAPQLQQCQGPASTMVLHVDVFPDQGVVSWVERRKKLCMCINLELKREIFEES